MVPLGLPLTGHSWTARRRALWLAAAACGAVSWWLPRGRPAAALAAVYLVAALWLLTKATKAPRDVALDWAAGEATGVPHLSLSWMVATHGVANALGFALCAILGYRRIRAATAAPR